MSAQPQVLVMSAAQWMEYTKWCEEHGKPHDLQSYAEWWLSRKSLSYLERQSVS